MDFYSASTIRELDRMTCDVKKTRKKVDDIERRIRAVDLRMVELGMIELGMVGMVELGINKLETQREHTERLPNIRYLPSFRPSRR